LKRLVSEIYLETMLKTLVSVLSFLVPFIYENVSKFFFNLLCLSLRLDDRLQGGPKLWRGASHHAVQRRLGSGGYDVHCLRCGRCRRGRMEIQ
jgi:hypothetical protein